MRVLPPKGLDMTINIGHKTTNNGLCQTASAGVPGERMRAAVWVFGAAPAPHSRASHAVDVSRDDQRERRPRVLIAVPIARQTHARAGARPLSRKPNAANARQPAPGIRNNAGRRVRILGDQVETREIVGVIAIVKHVNLNEEPRAAMYVPLAQYPPPDVNIAVRTAGPLHLGTEIQDTVRSLERDEAISAVRPMEEILAASVAQPRFSAMLLAIFAVLALLLAAVGIYGLVAYTASQRTREIGIRIALGAARHDILGMVLADGLWLVLAGTAIGLIIALAFTRLLRGMLFGVHATDPVTFAGVTGLLLCASLAACWVPARRATRVDPIVALRQE